MTTSRKTSARVRSARPRRRAPASVAPSSASAPTTVKLSANDDRTNRRTSAPSTPTTVPNTA